MFGNSALYFIPFNIKEKRLTFVKILRLKDRVGIVFTEEKLNA